MRRYLSLVGVLGVVLLATAYGALGVPLTLGSTGPADTGSLADTPEGADSTAGSNTTTTTSNPTTTTASTDTETTTTASTTTSSSGDTTTTSTTDDPATTSTAGATTTATQTASSPSGASSQADDTAGTTTTTSSAPTSGSDQSGDGSDTSDDTDGDATASDEVNVSFPSCTEVRIDNLEDSEWELEYVSLRVWLLDDWTRDGPPPIDTHMTGLPQNDTGPVYTYANDSLVRGDLYIVNGVTLVSPEGEHVEWSNPRDCEFVVGVSDNGTVSQPRDDS